MTLVSVLFVNCSKYVSGIIKVNRYGGGLWCLMSLSTIIKLYRGGKFYWCVFVRVNNYMSTSVCVRVSNYMSTSVCVRVSN
jgi:hypothetical protein